MAEAEELVTIYSVARTPYRAVIQGLSLISRFIIGQVKEQVSHSVSVIPRGCDV